jgi:hypothetical protein
MIRGKFFPGNYQALVTRLRGGLRVSPRGVPTLELDELYHLETDGMSTVHRTGMSVNLAILESLMIIAGELDLEKIAKVAPKSDLELWKRQSDYGPRIANQIPKMIEVLRDDPASRRAVLYLNDGATAPNDMACSSTIQYLIRDDLLSGFVNFRSWDVAFGYPVDIMTHSILSQVIADTLNLALGSMNFITPSLHIYDKTADLAVPNGYVTFYVSQEWPTTTDWDLHREFASLAAKEFAKDPRRSVPGLMVRKVTL